MSMTAYLVPERQPGFPPAVVLLPLFAEQSSMAIAMLDTGYRGLYLNPAMRRLVGLSALAPAAALDLARAVAQQSDNPFVAKIDQLLARHGEWRGTLRLYPVDQATRPILLQVTLSAIRDNQGARIGVALVGHGDGAAGGPQASDQGLLLLTDRERDVLRGLIAGGSNKSIGRDLNISPRTIESHRSNLMRKLGVRSLPELIRVAMRGAG